MTPDAVHAMLHETEEQIEKLEGLLARIRQEQAKAETTLHYQRGRADALRELYMQFGSGPVAPEPGRVFPDESAPGGSVVSDTGRVFPDVAAPGGPVETS